ncbi:hypothetical protein [Chromatium okenii]
MDWWFTEEARKPKQGIPGYAPPKPTTSPLPVVRCCKRHEACRRTPVKSG